MKLDPKKIAFGGGALFCFCVGFGYYGFDKVLKFGVRDQTALRKRNEVRDVYTKLPFPLDFRVNFFNISNPDEVMKGVKPMLKEVGPYCYDLWKEKIEIEDNNAEDSLSYTQYDIYHFNQEKSGSLRDTDYVTILHPLIVGIANTVERDSPALLNVVNKAIPPIFNDPTTMYLTVRVKDILFDGVKVYCTNKDFTSKAVCTQLKTQIPGIKSSNEKNVYLFSLLGPRNGTHLKRFKVLKGIKHSKDLGRLLELDSQNELKIWGTPQCNRFKGTDGWIFPPGLDKEEGIWSFSADLCRSVGAYFVEDIKYKGLNLRRYHADMGDMEHREDEKCYCAKTCNKKGIFDLSKCMGVYILGSLPHFLLADEIYLTQVDGLNPRINDHIIYIFFEPLSGTPMEAKKRLQFNMPVHPIPKVNLLKNVTTCLHPLFWVEEGVVIEGHLFNKIAQIFLLIKLMSGAKYVGMLAGAAAGGAGAYLHFKNKKSLEITKIEKTTQSLKNDKNIDEDNNEINSISNLKSGLSNTNSGASFKDKNNKSYVKHIMSGHELDKY